MIRKKKGSTLITIVIVCSLVLTVGMAMLTMTLGDYRMRINESDRIQNLYGSESGLDGAYNIIVKTFDGAARYGALKVETLKNAEVEFDEENEKYRFKQPNDLLKYFSGDNKNDYLNCLTEIYRIRKDETEKNKTKKIEEQKEIINKIFNNEFKRSFKNFIYSDDDSTDDNFRILPVLIWKQEYININKEDTLESMIGKMNNLSDTESLNLNSNPITYIPLTKDDIKKYEKKENNHQILSYSEINTGLDDYPNEEADELDKKSKIQLSGDIYQITVRSIFETNTDEIKDKHIGRNKKKVETIYNMKVPEYQDVAFSESNANIINIPELNNDKVIIVGKNMTIHDASDFTITGDVYVCGDTDNEVETLFNSKYNGGIILRGISSGKFNGKVITQKTINSGNNVNVTVNGNTYCKNIYIGNKNKEGENVENSNLYVIGDAIVDNDIASKAYNSTLDIKNFYGINDKNIKKNNFEKSASSIIVNDSNNENGKNTIKIHESAYIYGVSIIDTTSPYITGESTGVKGNYVAYANMVDPQNDKFEYYNPLQLLEVDRNEDEVQKKAEHFKRYWSGDDRKAESGGISLPKNTKAIGAIVYNDGTIGGENWNENVDGQIIRGENGKQKEYAKNVYYLVADDKNDNTYNATKELGNLVSNIFLVDNIRSEVYNAENEKNNYEKAIFSNGKVIITKGEEDKCSVDKIDNDITISTGSDGKLNSVIVSEGDVEINDDIEFRGTIITKGNLELSSKAELTYDKDLIQRIQAANSDIFESVFNSSCYVDSSKENNNTEILVRYDLGKFLKTDLWRIIK